MLAVYATPASAAPRNVTAGETSVEVGASESLVNVTPPSVAPEAPTLPDAPAQLPNVPVPETNLPGTTTPSSPSSGSGSNNASAPAGSKPAAARTSDSRATNTERATGQKESAGTERTATGENRTPEASAASGSARSGDSESADRNTTNESLIMRTVGKIPAWLLAITGALALAFLVAMAMWFRATRRGEQPAIVVDSVDPLTGFANKRGFDRRLGEESRRAKMFGHRLGLIVLEINDFSTLTQQNPTERTDAIVRDLATVLRGALRGTDLVARVGPGEFAVVCPETDEALLSELRDRLDASLADAEALPDVYVGVACTMPSDQTYWSLLNRARRSLKERKPGPLTLIK
ncbi:MAG: GGDEF domain-containing protein [Solirubrobacterales bacterium]